VQIAVTAVIAAISLTSVTSLVWPATLVRFAPGPLAQVAARNWGY
jgi:hypothetical protein